MHFLLPVAGLLPEVHDVQRWISTGGYAVLFGLLFSCGLGFPLPEDVPLIASGILIFHGKMNFFIAAPVAWFGIVGGDCILYLLGYHYGEKIVHVPIIGRHVTLARLRRAEAMFLKYGVLMVGIGRLFMGIRGAMVVTAGTSRFKFIKFIIADGLAAIASGGMFLYLGYWGGKNGPKMWDRIREFKHGMWMTAGGVAIALIIFFYFRERKYKVTHEFELSAKPSDSPISGISQSDLSPSDVSTSVISPSVEKE